MCKDTVEWTFDNIKDYKRALELAKKDFNKSYKITLVDPKGKTKIKLVPKRK
jgi:hypothetical protein